MTEEPIIQIRDLRKVFPTGDVEVHALRGVDLDVKRSEFVAVIGPSGSGKSTLFHILGGMTPSSGGSVLLEGKDVALMTESERTEMRKTKVGFVFQRYNLLPTLTVRDNILIARAIAGLPVELDADIRRVVGLLGIGHRLGHKPRALSGGEHQRVAIARAVVNRPSILLADEPTGNLDTDNSNNVLALLRELNETTGQTLLIITHNPEAADFADRIVQMRDGRIIDSGGG